MVKARTRVFSYYLHTAAWAERLLTPLRHRVPLPEPLVAPSPMQVYDDALEWMNSEYGAAVELCRQGDLELDSVTWKLAFQFRSYFYMTKRYNEWIESYEHALASAVRNGDRLGEAIVRSGLGVALHGRDQDDAAMAHQKRAEELFTALGDLHGRSNTLVNQAAIHRRLGDLNTALQLNETALAFYRSEGASRYVGIALRTIGKIKGRMSRYEEAEAHLREAIDLCDQSGMAMEAARSRNLLGRQMLETGRVDAAVVTFRAAITASQQCGSHYEEAIAWRGLGQASRKASDNSAAVINLRNALRLLKFTGSDKTGEVEAEIAELVQADASSSR
ncbi:hypothetical protein GCM10029992_08000 [Glycomyces albus]